MQWCPSAGQDDLLAVGLYQLKDDPTAVEGDDTPKLRIGRILLMQLQCVWPYCSPPDAETRDGTAAQ